MNKEMLKRWIKKHEGFSANPYICTAGKLSIGYGRNLQDNGILQGEAEFMFQNDFNRCEKELHSCSWYMSSPENVKNALLNMCFNLGLPRLKGFKRMIAAIEDKDYTKAALEAMDSKWAAQVPDRAKDIALMIRDGHTEELLIS